jgi:hypothetical protein
MPNVVTDQEEAAALAQRFTVFWTQYPRKVGKVAAWQLFRKIHPDQALLERMLATLAWQVKDRSWREDPRFIPHPRTWLYQGRWEDEPFEPQSAMALRSPGPLTRTQRVEERNQETLRRFLARERGEEP